MSDQIIIYAAGNPAAYPLEYYDASTESYQGVIPQLLAQFSAQSRYEIIYYPTQGADRREHLAKNQQVDLLSGYTEGDTLPAGGETMVLFHTVYQGRDLSYYLCFTSSAPADLKADLESFFAAVPQEEISGILMETSADAHTPTGLYITIGALSIGVVLLLCAIFLLMRRYRRRLRNTQQQLERDEITGLGNFDCFQRYYSQLVNDKNRILYTLIFFYVDTDRLRRLSDTQELEEALRFCAVVLQEYTGDTDILARVSEHGFVLLKLSGNTERLHAQVQTILQRLRAYPQVCGKEADISVAAGLYSLRAGDRDLNEMIFNAEQEARHALKMQANVSVFSHQSMERRQMEQNLRRSLQQALERHEFALYIQFYVDAYDHRIVGGEALSRWLHPEKGLLPPSVFVPMLEQEDLISHLDYYCLRASCAFLQTLKERGVQDFFLSCNFSRETFEAADFAQTCEEILSRYDFPRELLIFELTESAAVKHLSQLQENMARLKACGVSIALDDFGEGVTSFTDLQHYPIDGIKLDKHLIDNMSTGTGLAILRAVVQIGHELDITILAEGVENQEQAQMLQQIHCDAIQGFRFYAPLPEAEAASKILQQFKGPAPNE